MADDAAPWKSKGAVNRAGMAVRNGTQTEDDVATINAWRAAHFVVLNTFQALLRTKIKVIGTDAKIGQRHKRRNTIFDKLTRLPDMQLAALQDVAGCRVIFHTLADLHAFRANMHASRFKHKLKNKIEKYDYIAAPKDTGYRGVHDIYRYESLDKKSKFCQGLLVEIQYRTMIQHAWATANEVIGHVTTSQPKFQRGDQRYIDGMRLASEILTRAHEPECAHGLDLSDHDLVARFHEIDTQLLLLDVLAGVKHVSTAMSQSKLNMILIYSEGMPIEIRGYQKNRQALDALFQIEQENPDKNVVLVKAPTTEEVRIAFRNYFSDAHDFVTLMRTGINVLAPQSPTPQSPPAPLE